MASRRPTTSFLLHTTRSHHHHHHTHTHIHARLFSSSSSTPTLTVTPSFLHKINHRIASFDTHTYTHTPIIPLIPNTPATSRIRLPENKEVKQPRTAAVLIPLCNRHGEASLLFQLRTSTVKTHKGQVSYPGGHIEANETPLEAALRETREEMGESIGKITVLGECQQLPAVTGTIVTPILAFVEQDVGDLSHLTPSPDEVESIFTLSLSQLLDPALAGREDLGARASSAPFFLGGTARVWGLTAFITEGILTSVLKPVLEEMEREKEK